MSLRNRNILDIKKKAGARSSPVRRAAYTPVERGVRLKTKRRRQKLLALCICVLCGAGLVASVGAASRLERLAINDVQVIGAKDIPAESLVASVTQSVDGTLLKLFSKKNIFLYPKGSVEQTLATAFPRIKDVSLSRQSLFAQAVTVTLEERVAFARWCPTEIADASHGARDGSCYLMDAHGLIFAPYVAETTASPYMFRGGLLPETDPVGQSFLFAHFDGIVTLLAKLAAVGVSPAGITVMNEKDFSIELTDGPTLYVPFDMDADAIARNLKDALESDPVRGVLDTLTYIDLRFGNRVYFK